MLRYLLYINQYSWFIILLVEYFDLVSPIFTFLIYNYCCIICCRLFARYLFHSSKIIFIDIFSHFWSIVLRIFPPVEQFKNHLIILPSRLLWTAIFLRLVWWLLSTVFILSYLNSMFANQNYDCFILLQNNKIIL